jgi:hypothetical protein
MAKKATPRKTKATVRKARAKPATRKTGKGKGKPNLPEIFLAIKKLMVPYEKSMVPRLNTARGYDLWSEKDVMFAGRQRKEVYFAGLVIQSNYVGLYYMPIYATDEFRKVFKKPELLKTLKGKSCFHIKTLDPEVLQQIKEALRVGFDIYKDRGWV